MRAIKTYSKEAPFYNAFIRTWLVRSGSDAACFSGNFVVSSAGEAYDARNRAPNRDSS